MIFKVVWILPTHHSRKVIAKSQYESLIFKADLIFYLEKRLSGVAKQRHTMYEKFLLIWEMSDNC